MGQRHTVVNMISTVLMTSEFEFMLIKGRGNPLVFKCFLEKLIAGTEKSIILVVNGYRMNKAKIIKNILN